MKKKKKKKKEKKIKKECQYLFIDIFGHPYCTRPEEEAIGCKFSLPSDEYLDMKQQLNKQRENNKNNEIPIFSPPSTYRCTVYDNYADGYGHLPEHMRSGDNGKFKGITIEL